MSQTVELLKASAVAQIQTDLENATAASATAAAGSATAAATSAANAATSETNAGNSATSAANSASAASDDADAAAGSATAASGSATSAANSATDAANSASEASDSADAAAISATNAATSETNANTSAGAAATSASAASTSAGSANSSASAAASSATTALNAISQQFKGGIAGNAVPSTSTTTGDTYRITSAGTSQSKTWVVGDAAIYNGTSGSWTQLTGFFAGATAYTDSIAAVRAPVDRMFFDGAVIGSAGGYFNATLPAAIGTDPFTLISQWGPTPSSSTFANLVRLHTSGGASYNDTTFGVFAHNNGNLYVRFGGDSNNRQLRNASVGAEILLGGWLVVSRSSVGAMSVWLNGRLLSMIEESNGAAPAWSDAVTGTYLSCGAYTPAFSPRKGSMLPPRVFNHAWAQEDVDHFRVHGRAPAVSEFAGTQQLLTADQSGFEAGHVANWGVSSEASHAVYDHTADPDGIGPAHGGTKSVKITIAAGSGAFSKGINSPILIPATLQVVDVEAWVYVPSGNAPVSISIANGAGWVQTGTTANSGAVVDQWVKITLSGIVRGAANNGSIRIGGSYGVTAGAVAYVDDVKIIVRGTIADCGIGWTAQARGKANRIHGTIMSGVTPLPAHDSDVQIIEWEQSATGYLLGFTGPHVFRDHKIDRVEAMPTTSTIPTITLRRNATSGGTPLVNAISAGAQNQWTSLAITGGTADGAAGDYYHITLGSAANVKLRISLSKR